MADITALRLRISVDGKPAEVEFRNLGRAVGDLKGKLAEIKKAGEEATH